MSQDFLSVEIRGGVAWVRLQRPDVHNALNSELIVALRHAFESFSGNTAVRVVVLAGVGKSFCAGADLNYMRQIAGFGEEQNRQDALELARMFDAIDHCPKPVVARVQGVALGGGMGLLCACDIVVAAESARFAFTECRLGIVPAVISPYVLNRVSVGVARDLFLTARSLTAQEALRIGLASKVVEDGRLDLGVQDVVAELLRCGPEAQRVCKELLRFVPSVPRNEVQAFTTQLIASLRASEEGQAGMESFLNRTKAPWVMEPPAAQEIC